MGLKVGLQNEKCGDTSQVDVNYRYTLPSVLRQIKGGPCHRQGYDKDPGRVEGINNTVRTKDSDGVSISRHNTTQQKNSVINASQGKYSVGRSLNRSTAGGWTTPTCGGWPKEKWHLTGQGGEREGACRVSVKRFQKVNKKQKTQTNQILTLTYLRKIRYLSIPSLFCQKSNPLTYRNTLIYK